MKTAGKATALIDGVEKVTGRARFTADISSTSLVGEVLRSPHAHAEILRIDASRARALPGVRAVVTGEDCKVAYGVLPIGQNEYPLARGRVRYWGEPVAAVAADDEKTARAALGLIEVEYRTLPAYFSAAEASKPDAVLLHADKPGNLEREVRHSFGEVDAGFAAADLVREAEFRYAEVTHAQMEPDAALAEYDAERGRLTLQSVTQVPYYVHLTLAQCLGMRAADIRIIKPFVGGGFGHRTECLNIEIISSLLAPAPRGAVRIDVSSENHIPTAATAGSLTVREGLRLHLDASASTDIDGDALTYEWALNNDGDFSDFVTTDAVTSAVW
jgi:4-hydroxybenzoyl-CoA reductase subunit alpha